MMPDWSKWVAVISIVGTLMSIAVSQGRIIQKQEDLERDIRRLETALVLTHQDTAKALGLAQE